MLKPKVLLKKSIKGHLAEATSILNAFPILLNGVRIKAMNISKTIMNIVIPILVCLLVEATVWAEVVNIPKEGDWAAAINALHPGDIAQLEPGRYTGGRTITVSGTPGTPIIIRGYGQRASTFDGEGIYTHALYIKNCADLIVENVNVTNPSPYGIDGRNDYSYDARALLRNGITTLGGARITIRSCRFADIATRGIFIATGNNDITVEQNVMVRVGDDTASSDIDFQSYNILIRENLLAGNVDGVVTDQGQAIIERNLTLFHKWENGIDIKGHNRTGPGDIYTTIQDNVIYAQFGAFPAIELHNNTDNVHVYSNVIHGRGTGAGGGACVAITGKQGTVGNHDIVGNWFDAYGTGGRGFVTQTEDGSSVENIWVLHNIFQGFIQTAIDLHVGTNLNFYNNIFTASKITTTFSANVATNLCDNTAVWSLDSNPIIGTPIYTEAPIGPLANGSPGKGVATILVGHDFGPDVGIPPTSVSLVGLEDSILSTLETVFTFEEINECMQQGGLTYTPSPVYSKPGIPYIGSGK